MGLNGRNISLVPYSEPYRNHVAEWMNSWDALDHYRDDVLLLPPEHDAWGDLGTLVILRNRDATPVGFVRILDRSQLHRHARLDYHLIPELRHTGLGLEAAIISFHYCFHYLNCHKVVLTIYDSNAHALTVAQKLGFREDGRFRDHILKHQQYHDVVVLSLLETEYAQSSLLGRLERRFFDKPQT